MTRAAPFLEEPVAVGNLICTRMYLTTLLIRRDLRILLIKHPIQHHKCMHANALTNHYQFILNCVFPTRLCASGDVDV